MGTQNFIVGGFFGRLLWLVIVVGKDGCGVVLLGHGHHHHIQRNARTYEAGSGTDFSYRFIICLFLLMSCWEPLYKVWGQMLPSDPGTYVVLLCMEGSTTVNAGALGSLRCEPGWYLYVGSAMGPGGLKARIGRHLEKDKKCRWHVDYLRMNARVAGVWFARGKRKRECFWAARLYSLAGSSVPFRGFGASDCRCPAHLYRFDKRPSPSVLKSKVVESLEMEDG